MVTTRSSVQVRLRVQYGELEQWRHTIFRRFFDNVRAYYWYHIMLDTHACLGFSSPWWDTLVGTNPFKSQWAFASPLPFVDFLFVDYGAEIDAINAAFDEYRRDGPAFLARMKADIARHWDRRSDKAAKD